MAEETKITRMWAMPNRDTFSIKPIGEFVQKYYRKASVSIDPFARNSTLATHTNDLNPETSAQHHMDSIEFLEMLVKNNIACDLVLFDPPYSPRQIKECYDSIGLKMKQLDAMRTNWQRERDLINQLLLSGGYVLSFGWNSMGMGKKRNYVIEEILTLCHGVGHNDTICIVERQTQPQFNFESNSPTEPVQQAIAL